MLSYLVPIFPWIGQNDIKALQVAQSKDLFCKRQQGIMFVDRELRREGTEDPVFDGAPRPESCRLLSIPCLVSQTPTSLD